MSIVPSENPPKQEVRYLVLFVWFKGQAKRLGVGPCLPQQVMRLLCSAGAVDRIFDMALPL